MQRKVQSTPKKGTGVVKASRTKSAGFERELYASLFRDAVDGIFVSDGEGNYVDVNARGCKMLGYTRREILCMNLRDLLPEADAKNTPFRDLSAGETVVNERRLRRKNGKLLNVEIRGRMLSNGFRLEIVRDISDRKAVAEILDVLARFPEEDPNPVLRVDEKGRVLYANEASLVLLQEWKAEVGRILPKAWKKFMAERIRDGSRATVDVPCGERIFSIQFAPIVGAGYVNLYGRDVTDRRLVEKVVSESERRFRALIGKTAEIIAVVDDQLIVKFITPSVRTIMGYEPEEIFGHNLLEWMHPDDISFVLGVLQDLKQIPGTLPDSVVARGLHKDGTWHFVEAMVTNLLEDPAIQGIVLNMRDVTERKIHEGEVQAEAMIAQAVSESLDLQPLLERLLEAARHAIPASEKGSLALMEGGDRLQVRAVSGYEDPAVLGFSYPITWGYAGRAAQQRCPVLVADTKGEADLKKNANGASIEEVRDLRSAIAVPLLAQNVVMGVLSLESTRPAAFQEEDLRLLNHFAVSAALIIERTRLFEESRRQTQETSALLSTSLALNSLNLQATLQTIGEHAKSLFVADGCRIFLLQPDEETLRCVLVLSEDPVAFSDLRIRIGEGVTGAVAASGEAEIVNDMLRDPRSVHVLGTPTEDEAIMFAPLKEGDRTIGVISIRRVGLARPFLPDDLELLKAFASLATSAVSNARLFEATRRSVDEFAALYESSRALAGELSADEVLRVIVENARRLLGVTGVGMYLYNPLDGMLEVNMATDALIPIGTRIALGEGLAGKVAQSRTTMRVDDYSAWTGRVQQYEEVRFRAVLETPMIYHDDLVGVLVVYETGDSERKFTESDERLLSLFVVQAAAAIQNAHLFESTRRRAREAGALLSTSLALGSLDLQSTLQTIGEHSKALFNADGCRIFLLEPDGETLRCALVLSEDPAAFSDLRIGIGEGVTGSVAASGEAEIVNDMLHDPRAVQVPGTEEEPEAIMFAPLKERGRAIGVISIRRVGVDHPFLPGDLELLQAFASLATSTVSNARLFEETRQRVAELETIHECGLAFARALDPKEAGQKIVELLEQKMGWRHTAVRSYNPQTETLELLAFNQPGITNEAERLAMEQRMKAMVPKVGRGLSGWAVQHAQIVRSGNVETDPRYADTYPGLRSGLYVPMQLGNRVVGVISIESEKADAFSEADERLAATLATQAASALENARLFDETHQHAKELETLNRISVVLRTAADQKELLSVVLNETLGALKAEDGAIHLWDPETNNLRQVVARGWLVGLGGYSVPAGEGIMGMVFSNGEMQLSREFADDPLVFSALPGKVPARWGGACVPIRSTEQMLGVLLVAIPGGRELDREEIRLLETLGEMTGTALHRIKLYEDTVRQIDHLQSLRVVDRAIAGSLDHNATLNILLDQVLSQLGVSAADVLLLDPALQVLHFAAGKGLRTNLSESTTVGAGGNFAGRAVLERRLVRVEDREAVRASPSFFAFWEKEGFKNYCAAPLIAKGQVKGVLEVFQREPFNPDLEWLNFLETMADQAAIAIDNAQMFEKLQRANLELTLSYEETIEGWSQALDLRDKETEGHTQRVTDMTVQLARAMGCAEEELAHIRRGALLHDIGKMGVPDSILLKPGPLTAEEWEMMKRHPAFALEVLAPIRYLKAAALDIPYSHHEKWDGSGYPRGLKGEQIPLSARIFAVVDVFDALTSDRPYRPAWTREKAIEYIRSQSGSHFDPAVVNAFWDLLLTIE